ncbi:SEP-domain-containing protein [Fistulina hepatica ATCC 64428]|uniref:SEP-domain-containing protein n=1 Tax=Fistulina hepatica ATCC 64428 TaxID=1128425 RepID=A0A0D7A343_9AGAR|nr:SEP-domain-containing protein [Fistulina hepatica ATCC 64428]
MSEDDSSVGHSLSGGRGEPLPAAWARNSSSSTPRIGRIGAWESEQSSSGARNTDRGSIHTFRDIAGSSAPPPSRDDDDDDDDDNSPEGGESWFAGGERSGISVQNPDRPGSSSIPGGDMVRNLLRRAAEAGPAPAPPSDSPRWFTGGGHTLGSDDVPSAFIPDPNQPNATDETAIRHITFWSNGFSVEDGELMRYDDPAHAQILEEINSGQVFFSRAPPSILNVRPGQPVELRVSQRTKEEYVPSHKPSAFGGAGHRLGAPVPAETAPSSSISMPGAMPDFGLLGGTSRSTPGAQPRFEVDRTMPTTSLQIRLADGTRIVSLMNLTHTVGDIRNFINASRPGNASRPYSIGTTFPNRVLEDDSTTIEAAGLKNSVIVQRWL